MTTVRDQFWSVARALGIRTVFGNPGSTEMTYLADFPADLQFVLGLQEGATASMADGYAQVTGEPTMVFVHTAPGAGNALGALLSSRDSHAPLVVVAGNQVRSMIASRQWLVNDDPTHLLRPAVKWAMEPSQPDQVPAVLAQAVHMAMSPPRGPVFVSLPMDDYDVEIVDTSVVDDLAGRRVTMRAAPDPVAMDAVLSKLLAARNPVLVLGQTADLLGGRDDAVAVATSLGLPVWAAPSCGRSVFPTDSPNWRGYLPFGYDLIADALSDHDLVVVVGAPVFTTYPNVPGRVVEAGTDLVMIGDDPNELARAPLGDAILGDPAQALALLRAGIRDRQPPPEPRPITANPAPVAPVLRDGARHPSAAQIFAALGPALPNAIRHTNESPSNLADFHTYVPQTFAPAGYLTTPNGGLGYGLPAAVGAAIADPSTPVLAVVGDGSLHYTGQALWTAAQHGAPVVTLVLRNGEYAILKAFADFEQVSRVPGLDLPALDAVAYATSYGVDAHHVDGDAAAVRDAVLAALESGRPTLVQCDIDNAVPSLT